MGPENEEFKTLWDASGWQSHAEAARKLELSRSVVGRFLTGEVKPSASTLKLFKLILLNENPAALTGASLREEDTLELSEWEREVFRRLRALSVQDRETVLNAINAFVAGLPARPPAKYASLRKRRVKSNSAHDYSGGNDPKKVPIPAEFEEDQQQMLREDAERKLSALPSPVETESGHGPAKSKKR